MNEKIGQYLVRLEYLSFEQAEEVLKSQKSTPDKKFGEIAIDLGYITEDDLILYEEDYPIN